MAGVIPLLVAHRGAMVDAPENTRSAFDRALSFPVDGIEFDVHSSSDGIPVIFHDDTLKKINGTNHSAADYTFDQLADMDWGGWFSPAHAGEKVLTLDEVLALYAHRTRLMVEIKPAPQKMHNALYRKLARTVALQMRTSVPEEFQDNLYVLSFDPELLRIVLEYDPDRKCVLNLEHAVDSFSGMGIDAAAIYGWGLEFSRLNADFVALSRRLGLKIMTYSCNFRETVDQALTWGVDVIMTDDPGGIHDYIKKSV
jgi:glycerophosphoryl diester phosphodiesterase